MRFRLIALCVLLFSVPCLSSALPAQTGGDALQALKTLQSRCESGVTFDGYYAALEDTRSQLGAFFDSKESEKNPELSDRIERAFIAYQSAYMLWKSKLEYKQDFVSSDHPTIQIMLNAYPEAESLFCQTGQANVRDLISFFWDKADTRIAEAKRSISGKRRR
jgi:hypothetical protein